MKKTLLSMALALTCGLATAQVTTYVLQPPSLEGALEFTWAEWGQTPDLNDPANQVTGFCAFVDDGDPDPAVGVLGCNPLVNGADIVDKIAVVRRGACQFGQKALNAQDAGAIAVVVINNAPGAPIAMGGGDFGADITIPVVMITQEAGDLLQAEIAAGNVELLIGSVFGVYQYNLFTGSALVDKARYTANTPGMAAADNLNIPMGGWVKNFGSATQSDVALRGRILQEGTEVYNNLSTTATMALGDEVFFSLPTFSPGAFSGLYEISYEVESPNTDEFPTDNSFTYFFLADSIAAYARIDGTTRHPVPSAHYRPGANTDPFTSCSHFRSPVAAAYEVGGIYTSAAKGAGGSMDGEALEAIVYEWNDVFTGLSDATFTNLVDIASADYFYTENLGSQVIYIPFDQPVQLENNKRYLFCAKTNTGDVFIGFDEVMDYTQVVAQYDQPIYVINNGTNFGFFSDADDLCSGVSPKFTSNSGIGIAENDRIELTPFPNPTADHIRIPMPGFNGGVNVEIMDLAGQRVAERRSSVGGDQSMVVDMNGLANGTYVFRLLFDNGKNSTFRVVVAR